MVIVDDINGADSKTDRRLRIVVEPRWSGPDLKRNQPAPLWPSASASRDLDRSRMSIRSG